MDRVNHFVVRAGKIAGWVGHRYEISPSILTGRPARGAFCPSTKISGAPVAVDTNSAPALFFSFVLKISRALGNNSVTSGHTYWL